MSLGMILVGTPSRALIDCFFCARDFFVELEVQPCLNHVGGRLNLLDSLFCILESLVS